MFSEPIKTWAKKISNRTKEVKVGYPGPLAKAP
jgi:hypothetical protein